MNKETLFTIDIKELDNPFERQKLESLPNDILVELLVRHLKREIKAIEYIKEHFMYHIGNDRGDIFFEDNYIQDLVEILGDKENE